MLTRRPSLRRCLHIYLQATSFTVIQCCHFLPALPTVADEDIVVRDNMLIQLLAIFGELTTSQSWRSLKRAATKLCIEIGPACLPLPPGGLDSNYSGIICRYGRHLKYTRLVWWIHYWGRAEQAVSIKRVNTVRPSRQIAHIAASHSHSSTRLLLYSSPVLVRLGQ